MSNEPDFIRSSAVMAAGTLVSRLTGLIRNLLLVAALGTSIFADTFNVANTLPDTAKIFYQVSDLKVY